MTDNQRRSLSAKAGLGSSLLAVFTFAIATTAQSAFGSDWAGGNANWSSNASPGWNGTGVPNAIGATANHPAATGTVTVQDVAGGVTVGTITLTNNSANGWSITNTNGITLNQDGAGAGSATISNTNSAPGTSNLFISTGTITLADNLLITNTAPSTNANGAIQIASLFAGAGNITFANTNTAISLPGSIRLTGVSTFSGSVLIQKGTTTFNQALAFGGAPNTITIGQSGQGSAALIATTNVNPANPIVVAAGSGGTLTVGATSTSGLNWSGGLTLNGDVALNSESGGGNTTQFSGKVTGVGNISTSDTGAVALTNNTNNYTGTTTVNSGSLLITQSNSLGAASSGTTIALGAQLRTNNTIAVAEPLTLNGIGDGTGNASDGALRVNAGSVPTFSGPITLGSSGVLLFNNATAGTPTTPVISGGITGTNTDLTVSSLNSSGNWTVTTNPIDTGTGSLTKAGQGTLTLATPSLYSGGTTVSGGVLVVTNSSGSATGTGGIAINSGTFGGTGGVTGAVIANSTAIVAPGTAATPIAALATGALTLNSGSTFAVDLDSNASLSLAADLLNANGALTIAASGALLSITDAGNTALPANTKFTLISYSGTWNGNAFDTHPDDSNITIGANTFVLNYNDVSAGGSNFDGGSYTNAVTLTLTAVPEANAFWLGGAICLVLGLGAGGRKLLGNRAAA